MNLLEKLQKKYRDALAKLKELRAKDILTDDERTERDSVLDEIEKLTTDIDAEQRAIKLDEQNGSDDDTNVDDGQRTIVIKDKPIYHSRAPLGEQMVDIAAMAKRVGGQVEIDARSRHEKMVTREITLAETRAAGTGGHVVAVGEDGGLLLQGETSIELITNGFNNSAVLSRTANRDIGMNQFVELVGIDETSRANGSRGGGVRVYTDKELAQMIQSKTKFDKIRIEPKRLTGLYFASDEILMNAPILQGEMAELFDLEFGFKGQDLVINGDGAGEALGLLNAPALVTVAKESGQAAKTILFENLINMKARIMLRNRASLVWIANQDIEPQLFTLSLPVGTGGSVMPVYIPSSNPTGEIAGTLLGVPIIFVEQCATLGTKGDLILADWSTYWTANKGGLESASSIHLKFDFNQTTFRFRTWFDGQPRLRKAILPYKANANSDRVSPFVTLAARG